MSPSTWYIMSMMTALVSIFTGSVWLLLLAAFMFGCGTGEALK